MNVIMLLFDSLNRRFLSPYGATGTVTPNFERLSRKSVRFNNCYAGSLPCIPARRELHTGRYNFLHRSWGPLEPFDDSMPRILSEHGIHSHLISDHGHYWETGGATYHTRYATWDLIRGQEGDAWKPAFGSQEDSDPNYISFGDPLRSGLYRQNLANRAAILGESDFPLVKTFDGGLEFLKNSGGRDGWFLQIESFSPHEPFMASKRFKELYNAYDGKRYEWPDYAPAGKDADANEEVRRAYLASLSMCDEQLGRLLDQMDVQNLWDSTMLIVCTDHGFMLGEHGYFAKNYMPCYDEIAHTPLFIWNPRQPESAGKARDSLAQTVDIPVTVLDFFGVSPAPDMRGKSLLPVVADGSPVRDGALFGIFGGHICYTDGTYVYMRAPRDVSAPLYEYTLMPTHMMEFFSADELKTMRSADAFPFTKGCPVMKIESNPAVRCAVKEDLLFDLSNDPGQTRPLSDGNLVRSLSCRMREMMRQNDAPAELYTRMSLS